MSGTQEIAKAAKQLEATTLKNALKQIQGKEPSGDKEALVERYQSAVLEVGLKNFVSKLNETDVKLSAKVLNINQETDLDQIRKALEEAVLVAGINSLISKGDEKLLTSFCDTLGLGTENKMAMAKEIADEVMLTGMETFLNGLTVPTLKAHCNELKLNQAGNKKDLVERLMVCIFELVPLSESDPEKDVKDEKKDNKKVKEDEKKKDKEQEKKKRDRSKSPKVSRDKETKETKKSKKEKEEVKKKEKFVAPPLSTIGTKYKTKVELYDNFNLTDLVEYCKQQDIKASGKKNDVIKRILTHLLLQGEESKPKKRKSGGKKSKDKETNGSSKKHKTEEESK